jgi:hypothetical protein
MQRCIQKFPDWVDKEIYAYNNKKTHSEATRCVMAAKLTRLTHKIVIQLHLVAENCTICSSRFRRPVRKLLDIPTYIQIYIFICKCIDRVPKNSTEVHSKIDFKFYLHRLWCLKYDTLWNSSIWDKTSSAFNFPVSYLCVCVCVCEWVSESMCTDMHVWVNTMNLTGCCCSRQMSLQFTSATFRRQNEMCGIYTNVMIFNAELWIFCSVSGLSFLIRLTLDIVWRLRQYI